MASFYESLYLYYLRVVVVFAMMHCLFLAALWSPAGKELRPVGSLVYDFFLMFCHFPIRCPGAGVVLDWYDSCLLPSSLLLLIYLKIEYTLSLFVQQRHYFGKN